MFTEYGNAMGKNIASFINEADESELRLLLRTVEKKLMRLGKPSGESLADLEGQGDAARCLSAEQLRQATGSFAEWLAAARSPAQKRSRGRIWLAFLLIRHGALRLGEVLALDDNSDIDAAAGTLRVQGAYPRAVHLPADVMREIAALIDSPMFYSLRGGILAVDQGYLRRKFYERAAACGLPKDLLNPRILRHSRGMELLNGGVPLKAVQAFMGRNEREQLGLGGFSSETSKRVMLQYLTKEVKMRTSARNVFMGKVISAKEDGLLVEVGLETLSGLEIVAVITEESFKNLKVAKGGLITATVKAPQVILTEADKSLKTSARNKFSGLVSEVKSSSIASEVLVDLYEGSKACALVTNESVNKLGLKPGKEIIVMFKAFSVVLNAEN